METFELNQTLLKQRCLTCKQEFLPSDNLKSCPVDGTMLSPVFDDPFTGTTIDGKYEVIERIAIGAKAKIYKARHLHLDKFVALKVLQVGTSLTQTQVARFQQEAQVALGLVHPNIVRVYDYGALPQPYIAMEYLDGKTLSATIKESGPLPPQRALPLFIEIANAMCAAHAAGLVHRDLKPSNVIVDSGSGQAKVLDFGLVKNFVDDARYTKTGDIVGSPNYMSPEQWKGQPLDGRSDIYSLGCLMYEVLTGVSPFAAANPVESMFKHLEVKPPKPSKVRRGLKFPPGFDAIIGNCLVKDRNQRYRSMTDVSQDLLAIQSGKGRRVKSLNRVRTIRQVIGGWVAIQVLLFAFCALIIAYQIWNRPSWDKELDQAKDLQERDDMDDTVASIKLLENAEHEAEAAHAPRTAFEGIYAYLGRGYLCTGELKKGRDYITRAIEVSHLHAEDIHQSFYHNLLSSTCAEMGDYESALEHGKAAGEIAARLSDNTTRLTESHYRAAVGLRGLKRYAEAAQEYERARELAGKKLLSLKDRSGNPVYDAALKFIDDYLNPPGGESNPYLTAIDTGLGYCYHQLHRDRDSLQVYSQAARLAYLRNYDDLSEILSEFAASLPADHPIECVGELASDQHWPPALTTIMRAMVHGQQRNFSQALTELDSILKDQSSPSSLRIGAIILKGYCHHSLGKFTDAIDDYKEALALNRDIKGVRADLAICLLQMMRYDESISGWNELIKDDPNNHSYYCYRGFAYFAKGNFDEASKDLSQFLKLEDGRAENYAEATILLNLAQRYMHNDPAATAALLNYENRNSIRPWPYPLIKYLRGHSTIQDLKKSAGNDSIKLTDTFTYLGLDSLANDNPDKARKYLQWVVDHGRKDYLEYQLATVFLKRSKK
jgi:serine/threonine protein kinase/lipoprotein NlpI